jgi:hypothetical protein
MGTTNAPAKRKYHINATIEVNNFLSLTERFGQGLNFRLYGMVNAFPDVRESAL